MGNIKKNGRRVASSEASNRGVNVAGVRLVDAEDLSWILANLDADDAIDFFDKHPYASREMVPLELVLEIIENM